MTDLTPNLEGEQNQGVPPGIGHHDLCADGSLPVLAANAFERFPTLAMWIERLAHSNIEGMSLSAWSDFCAAVNEVAEVALCADDLIQRGLVNRGVDRGLVVIERADRSDPHYRLCTALEAVAIDRGGAPLTRQDGPLHSPGTNPPPSNGGSK